MATPLKYYGSVCSQGCEGHKAGYRYAKRGGRRLTNKSPSFNKGMAIAMRHLRNKRRRMAGM